MNILIGNYHNKNVQAEIEKAMIEKVYVLGLYE
jgi:hypothetical protein